LLSAPQSNRVALYVSLNVAFLLVLILGYGIGAPQNPRLGYLVLLFALCSSYVVDLDGYNGRYALLAIFLNMYWIYFGVQDLTDLYHGVSTSGYEGLLSPTETVILVGGILLVLSYRVVVTLRNPVHRVVHAKDWSIRSALVVGLFLWLVGIGATYYWYFFVVTDKTVEGTKGIARISQYLTSGLVLAQMLLPVGIMLLAYAWRTARSRLLLALILAVISLQFLIGFVVDIKSMAIGGLSLVIVTIILTDGRVPKLWIAAAAVSIYVAFPVFQAYRAVVTGNIARTEVLNNLQATLEKVLAAKERVNSGRDRAQTFLERLSLKASVQMIVDGTANGIPFQHGYTLEPVLAAFVPRILWTDKPDIPTGRIINKVFHVTDQEETYISPSHIGELYWNFGWPGVLVGMSAIGTICGLVARRNLAECRTVTHLLLTVITVELVVHGFEGSMAGTYVVLQRSLAAVGLLHLIFAKLPVTGNSRGTIVRSSLGLSEESKSLIPFPNLLR